MTDLDDIRVSTDMHAALQRGDADEIRRLIEVGEPADGLDLDLLMYPISWATGQGDLDLVRFLLDHGASIETPDPDGNTPLILAVFRGDAAMVRLLIERGTDCQYRVPGYLDALGIARSRGYTNIVALLEEALRTQGDPSKSNGDGEKAASRTMRENDALGLDL